MSVKFNKNGVIQSGGLSDTSPNHEMKIKTLDDGSVWARIHWLDVSTTVEWFASDDEVAKCIDKSNRYSRMGIIDLFKTSDGVYEFMLTYPSLSSTLYNRWSQTSSPNATSVTGYTGINMAWDTNYAGGLRNANGNTYTTYKCDPNNTWFTPIGQKYSWTDTQYIPAVNDSSQTSTELWVRIDNLPRQTLLRIYDDFLTTKDFIEF